MSLTSELEELIERTGSYSDRELLMRVLEQLKKTNSPNWGFAQETTYLRRQLLDICPELVYIDSITHRHGDQIYQWIGLYYAYSYYSRWTAWFW